MKVRNKFNQHSVNGVIFPKGEVKTVSDSDPLINFLLEQGIFEVVNEDPVVEEKKVKRSKIKEDTPERISLKTEAKVESKVD